MSGETQNRADVKHNAETTGLSVMEGESVLQNRRPGWGRWWKILAGAALVALIGISAGTDGVLFLVLAAVLVGYVAVSRMQSRYIVTDERIKMDRGLIRSVSREYRLSDVQAIDTGQSLTAQLFRIGDVAVRTADGTQITWRGIPDHEEVAQDIREYQRKYDASMDRK